MKPFVLSVNIFYAKTKVDHTSTVILGEVEPHIIFSGRFGINGYAAAFYRYIDMNIIHIIGFRLQYLLIKLRKLADVFGNQTNIVRKLQGITS